jgi:hypothetical protein
MSQSGVLNREGWNEVKTVIEKLEMLEVLRLGLVTRRLNGMKCFLTVFADLEQYVHAEIRC